MATFGCDKQNDDEQVEVTVELVDIRSDLDGVREDIIRIWRQKD